MHHIATKVEFLEDVTIQVTFQDGNVYKYDLSKMFFKYPQLEELRRNRKLFEGGHLDIGGYAVEWNDDLDFDATSIHEEGILVGHVETTINQQLGVLLAKTRDEANITQSQLASLSHIDQGDISKIEKGLGNPTLAKINKLFKALGKSVSLTLL